MTEGGLEVVRIVLVEPAGPLNVGSIARVMKNMGLSHLVLVNPHCDPLDPEARKMAVHAADVLEAAKQVTSLPEALQGCQRAIATTARPRSLTTILEPPALALPWLVEASPYPLQSALIFGPEDRGLSNQELNYAQRFVCIPSHPAYPALNLAQAVAVCCYELYQSVGNQGGMTPTKDPNPKPALSAVEGSKIQNLKSKIQSPEEENHGEIPPTPFPSASADTLEGYYQHLETLLLKIGYLHPHTTAARMEKFRRLFNRAYLSDAEVAMLRGILRQMDWALDQSHEQS
ncbi:MAG: RNA methyltransferase [Leptolyngbyaceae bacterium]|nr:RNA methyltransferase [Leptolyngbyaceae bacterium]